MIVCFARDGQETGQYPEEAVPQLIANGEILATDHYWHEGMDEWRPVSERWPASPPRPKATRPSAPSLNMQAAAPTPNSSRRWLIIAAVVAAALLGAAAYWYLTKPAEPTTAADAQAEQQTTPSPVATKPAPATGAKTISVIAWNLEWFPGKGQKASPDKQAAHMKIAQAELRKLNPDIFLAQEIASWDAFIELCSVVPNLDVAVVSHYLQGNQVGRQQTAIASKLPVMAAWYDNWKPAKDQPPRGYAAAVIEIPGTDKLLLVYSLHLKSNRARSEQETQENYDQRDESTRQLLAHIKVMEDEAFKGRIAGVIVGGDLNTNHDGQFKDNVVRMLTDAGFVNTWDGVPPEQRHTWRGNDTYNPTTFDYILTKGLDAATAELVEVSAEASDHWPLRLEIVLPKP